jgi:membrane carboxypeptidase/penicillin-binding protein PbpC
MKCPFCGEVHTSKTRYCPTTGKLLRPPKPTQVFIIFLVFAAVAALSFAVLYFVSQFNPESSDMGEENEATSLTVSVLSKNIEFMSAPFEIELINCVLPPETGVTTYVPDNDTERFSFILPVVSPNTYPHWIGFVLSGIKSYFDLTTINRLKPTVYTTLDPVLQELAEDTLKLHMENLQDIRANSAAIVAIRPTTGEILAMVGSPDFFSEEIKGQINMTTSPRQPGTVIMPLTYLATFEKGWTASKLIWDVPSEFPPSGDPNDLRAPYIPVNYDRRFRGPVTVRAALANSYNIPAVKALQYVGIYDNPITPEEGGFLELARRLGITTLTSDQYGLSLTLGGGEVTLLELTSAYATLANGGMRLPHYGITRILDHKGEVVFDYQPPLGQQVIRPEHAFLISSILSDNDARTPAFGANSVLRLPFRAAVKTGTTNDFRDNWTLGYTPDLSVGVWVGNHDYTPMVNSTGLTGAAPIWADFMQAAMKYLRDENPSPTNRPETIVNKCICTISGTEPSEWCPTQTSEYFAKEQLPLPKEHDLWSMVPVDTWTGLRTSLFCNDFIEEKLFLNINDPDAINWIHGSEEGKLWANRMGFSLSESLIPTEECTGDTPRPQLSFLSPEEGETYQHSPLSIVVVANSSEDFRKVRLEYGLGLDPDSWILLFENTEPIHSPKEIYQWEFNQMPIGEFSLRIYMESSVGTYAEKRVILLTQSK